MNIQERLEQAINKDQEDRKTRERSGLINPSSLGRCFRYQYWNRKNEEPSNPIPMGVLKRFRAGNIYHRDLQSLIEPEKIEFEFTIDDVHGFCDWVGEDFVADFKTIGNFAWKYIVVDGYDVEKDKESYCYQVMCEARLLRKAFGRLIFVNKDDYQIKTFEMNTWNWIDRIDTELETLREQWNKQELPEGKPRAFGGKECAYCIFRSRCKPMA